MSAGGAGGRNWLVGIVLLTLAACATAQPTAMPVNNFGAVGVCGTVAANPITGRPSRVDSDSCPAGVDAVDGWPYRWYYTDWPDDRDVDVVYVGGSLPPSYSVVRPARVQTINIYRDAPRDAATAESQCQCSAPTGAHVVQRSRQSAVRESGPSAGGAAAVAAQPSTATGRRIERGGFGPGAAKAGQARPAPRVSERAPVKVRTASTSGAGKSASKTTGRAGR